MKCRHIRSAFLTIDPNRPLDVLEKNLQLGFGMPPGCQVLRFVNTVYFLLLFHLILIQIFGSDDVVSYDDFVLLFSTGTMRLYSSTVASSSGSSKNETMSEK